MSVFTVCLCVLWSLEQHGLLHGEGLLRVSVARPSKQLRQLLPNDRLPLLELSPVAKQAVRVCGEDELLNGRHLGFLEAGRAGQPARRARRGQVLLLCVRVPISNLSQSPFWESVVRWSVSLRGGG